MQFPEDLDEFLRGAKVEFRPYAQRSANGVLFIYTRNVPSYTHQVSDALDLMLSFEDQSVTGYIIWPS